MAFFEIDGVDRYTYMCFVCDMPQFGCFKTVVYRFERRLAELRGNNFLQSFLRIRKIELE